MNKLEVLELTGGSVMLSKPYISFASWTVPTTKMKEVDPLPNFFFLQPLALYREAFCLLYMHELMGSLLLLSDEILLCLIQESGFLALLEQVLLLM